MSVDDSRRSSAGEVDGEKDSIAGSHDGVSWTAVEEARVVRKVDWHLLPGLTLLYLLSFLDRANVGNARILGLLTDIGITDAADYNTSLALYFLCVASLCSDTSLTVQGLCVDRRLNLADVAQTCSSKCRLRRFSSASRQRCGCHYSPWPVRTVRRWHD